jgi:hypothetical protein
MIGIHDCEGWGVGRGRKGRLLVNYGALLRVRLEFYFLALPHDGSTRLRLHALTRMATQSDKGSAQQNEGDQAAAGVFRRTVARVRDYRGVVRAALTISERRWIVAARTRGRWWRRAGRCVACEPREERWRVLSPRNAGIVDDVKVVEGFGDDDPSGASAGTCQGQEGGVETRCCCEGGARFRSPSLAGR